MSQESAYCLTLEEINQIINAAPTFRDRVIIEVFANTGIRRAELRDLKISDVDFNRRQVFIREGKGKKPRTVPIDENTLRDITQLVGNRKSGNIFTSPKSYPGPMSLKQINEIVAKCAKRAGINHPNQGKKQINPHLFRHSFVRNALRDSVPLQYIQKAVGHSSIKTTVDIYGTPSQGDVDDAYRKMMEKRRQNG